jgi:NAD(P)-dependent dehydrogenase (short-subunit alcohol dehydrogenase family)
MVPYLAEERGMTQAGDRRCLFVTGGASGIGRATATLLSEQGWFVGAYDVDEAGLASLREELGPERCITGRLDVSDKTAFDRAMEAFGEATGGRLDLLFNNAGVGGGGFFEDVPYEVSRRIVDVNLVGVLNGIYCGLPLLKNTPNSLCFTTASSAAIFGMARGAVYSATKFAVKALTEALSVEFARHDVRASDVLPGVIDTKILATTVDHSTGGRPGLEMRESTTAEGPMRLMQPEDVAACVLEAYGSDRLHWYVPEDFEHIERARAQGAEPLRDQARRDLLAEVEASR